jgi:hypothetical protein
LEDPEVDALANETNEGEGDDIDILAENTEQTEWLNEALLD